MKRVERGRPWLRRTEPGGGGGRASRSGGRRPLPLHLTATGALGVRCEVACVLGGLEGLPFIALPRRFAAAGDELVGDRRTVACRHRGEAGDGGRR